MKRLDPLLMLIQPTKGVGLLLALVLSAGLALAQEVLVPPAPIEPGLQTEWVIAPPDTLPPPAAQLPEGTVLQEGMALPPGTILPGGAILPAEPPVPSGGAVIAAPPALPPGPNAAEPPLPSPEPIAPVAQVAEPGGSVPYLSGGIGLSGREEMLQVKPQFNLHLLFAETGGAYLADIRVRIQDASGAVLLDVISQGPWFYAKLLPGRYRVSVENAGLVQTREVNIPPTGSVDLNFYW